MKQNRPLIRIEAVRQYREVPIPLDRNVIEPGESAGFEIPEQLRTPEVARWMQASKWRKLFWQLNCKHPAVVHYHYASGPTEEEAMQSEDKFEDTFCLRCGRTTHRRLEDAEEFA